MRNQKKSRSKSRSRKQNGGAVTLPAEYFGKDSGRYFPEGSSELKIEPSAYGPNIATSRGILINNELSGPDLGPTSTSGMQTGGKRSRSKSRSKKNKKVRSPKRK